MLNLCQLSPRLTPDSHESSLVFNFSLPQNKSVVICALAARRDTCHPCSILLSRPCRQKPPPHQQKKQQPSLLILRLPCWGNGQLLNKKKPMRLYFKIFVFALGSQRSFLCELLFYQCPCSEKIAFIFLLVCCYSWWPVARLLPARLPQLAPALQPVS